ncbi:hypothetical protein LguiB_012840 [Lonicera macranthoides]
MLFNQNNPVSLRSLSVYLKIYHFINHSSLPFLSILIHFITSSTLNFETNLICINSQCCKFEIADSLTNNEIFW